MSAKEYLDKKYGPCNYNNSNKNPIHLDEDGEEEQYETSIRIDWNGKMRMADNLFFHADENNAGYYYYYY